VGASCRFNLTCLAAFPALIAIGCGGPYNASVTGEVVLDGQPVPTGGIAFIPTAGGPTAYAQVDSSGHYEVRTGNEEGLPAGNYGVTVVSREPPASDRSKLGGPPPPGKAITPEWYADAKQTPLKFDVKPGKNEIKLELSKTPPPGWKPSKRR
jgi:hypothetical protein